MFRSPLRALGSSVRHGLASPLGAGGCLISAMALYGASFMAMKVALGAVDPWLVVFFRLSLAFTLLAALTRRSLPRWDELRPGLPGLLLMALCEPCLYFVFEAKALALTSSSQAGVITALLPVMVAVGAHFVHGERLGRQNVLGLVLGLAGAAGLGAWSSPTREAPDPFLGNLLEFAAMACATVYTLVVKSLVRRFSSVFLTAFQAGLGALFFAPALVLAPWPGDVAVEVWAAMVFLGVGVSAGGYLLYNASLANFPASRVGAAANLIPVFALAFGFAFLGETLSAGQWLAVALILVGSWLAAGSP